MKKTLKNKKRNSLAKSNFKKLHLISILLVVFVIGIAITLTLFRRSDCYKIRKFKSNLDIYGQEILSAGEDSPKLSVDLQNSSEAERFFMKKFYQKDYTQLVKYLENLKAKCDPIQSTRYSKGMFVVCKYHSNFLSSLFEFSFKDMKSPKTFSVLIKVKKDQTVADVIVDIYLSLIHI